MTIKEQVEKTLTIVQEAICNIRILSDYSEVTDSSRKRFLDTVEHLEDIEPLLFGYKELLDRKSL